MNETDLLQQLIEETIKGYRLERGFFGGSDMSQRDQRALTQRLTREISSKLEEVEREEIDRLEEEIADLEEDVRLASGSGYGELRQEYEAARALAKHLIYRLGREDDVVSLSVDDLHEMEERVDMKFQSSSERGEWFHSGPCNPLNEKDMDGPIRSTPDLRHRNDCFSVFTSRETSG